MTACPCFSALDQTVGVLGSTGVGKSFFLELLLYLILGAGAGAGGSAQAQAQAQLVGHENLELDALLGAAHARQPAALARRLRPQS